MTAAHRRYPEWTTDPDGTNPRRPRPAVLTVEQVAAILSVSKMSVYRRIHEGRLNAYRTGRLIRVYADSVDRYLAASRIVPEWAEL